MNGGVEYHPEIQRIQELEEELVMWRSVTTDLLLNMENMERQVRKYTEGIVINC